MSDHISEHPVINSGIANQIKETEQTEDSICLFYSLDLCNYTEFKNRNKYWPNLLIQFYELSEKLMGEPESDDDVNKIPKIWKYIGDEVLFYEKLSDTNISDKIIVFFKKIYAITKKLNEIANSFETKAVMNIRIKSTVWIAKVSALQKKHSMDQSLKHNFDDNYVIKPFIIYDINKITDFIGPDIDIGYRVAKFAHSEVIAISAELAYILQQCDREFCKQLRIVKYEILKGVWNNRHYPIIWYSPDWKKSFDDFEYDELVIHSHIKELKNNINISHKDDDFVKPVSSLMIKTKLDEMYTSLKVK